VFTPPITRLLTLRGARILVLGAISLLLLAGIGCTKNTGSAGDDKWYVVAPQGFLRDRVATVYNKTGTVRNGDQVEILEKGKRWMRVRNARGEEGWIEQFNLVGQPVFEIFQQLFRDAAGRPSQARAVLRNDFRLHVSPAREADKLFLVKEGSTLELLERVTVPKNAPPPVKPVAAKEGSSAGEEKEAEDQDVTQAPKVANKDVKAASQTKTAVAKPKSSVKRLSQKEKHEETPAVPMEDWWLVRDNQHAGWVLGRYLDVDVPLEIAQYAEGQRIVAFFVLTQVVDPAVERTDKSVPYYLVLLTPPRDGMPFDYDQARVFTWNLKRHRYETAYRERNLAGLLPVSVTNETFEKEGTLPVFVLHVKDDDGNVLERKYKMNGVIVKRVLPPSESAGPATRAGVAPRKPAR
jgi:uncharacterized protein YgiM (DUF1202 family)